MTDPWGHMFYIGLYKEKHETIVLSESLDIWYEASPSEPLLSLLKLYLCSQKWPNPRGQLFNIDI